MSSLNEHVVVALVFILCVRFVLSYLEVSIVKMKTKSFDAHVQMFIAV